jgi:hypothetical protein
VIVVVVETGADVAIGDVEIGDIVTVGVAQVEQPGVVVTVGAP